jgi:UDP-glucose 4-epimerase
MADKLHILVTGASGFVGEAFVRMAMARGHRITALVRDVAQTPAGCAGLVHSLGSGAPLNFPEGIDAVAHLAQSRAYRAFPGDADEMYRVNVAGTQELLLAAAYAKISRFCLISSGTVYEPFLSALTEDSALAPASNLGATKLAAEVLAQPYNALFPVSILRLFAPYGPGQTARLVPELIRRISQNDAVSLPAQGGGMFFAPTYVDDICQAMLAAIQDGWRGSFNVAAPEALSIEEAAQRIGQVLGKTPRIERNPSQTSPSPVVVPDLAKFGQQYDLGQFRDFLSGLRVTVGNSGT